MISAIQFSQKKQGLANVNTYLLGFAFVAGNLILPQICHLFPNGGLILLPIFFFTLIAAYKIWAGNRIDDSHSVAHPKLCFVWNASCSNVTYHPG